MSIRLDRVVPFGRSLREYELIFNLTADDCRRTILDCGGGPSSFNAELTTRGGSVVSFDPLYACSGAHIKQRFHDTVDGVIEQVNRTPGDWIWTYHHNSADLRRHRESALETFLADYEEGWCAGRYICASLPDLPFREDCFDLALCSHLLFLYSDLLSFDFHLASIQEILRVSRELRIFPLLALNGMPSPYVAPLQAELERHGWRTIVERVGYELQRGGNEMMRVIRC
jgi:hypothetical protein